MNSNYKFLPAIAGLWLALLAIIVLPAPVLAQGPIEILEEFQISSVNDNGFQAISGSVVVFDKDSDIYGYELSTATEFVISDHPANKFAPDISGDTVVWMDGRNGNLDIYGYDLSQDVEFQITDHPATQASSVIDGRTVVWIDWRNNGEESSYGYSLYGYNLATGVEFPISTEWAPTVCPAISGNVVVWSDRRSGAWELYRYDLSSGIETQITFGGASSPYCAAIDNEIIVLGQDNFVVGIDLSGNLLFETSTLLYPFSGGRPALDGNLVVWQEQDTSIYCFYDPCASTIVGYDITSGHKFLIPRGLHEAWFPAISGDVVVWRDYGTGFLVQPDPLPTAVYASKLLETVQLRANPPSVMPGESLHYTITLAETTDVGILKQGNRIYYVNSERSLSR